MRDICREWDKECEGSKWSDHGHLLKVLMDYKDELNVYYLPMQYIRRVPLKRKDDFFQVMQHNAIAKKVFYGKWQKT